MVGDLISSPIIRKVSLTGSVPAGREIYASAEGIKKVTMELGGHAPVIVYQILTLLLPQKIGFYKIPQLWSSLFTSRFYIHHSIIEPFAKAFVEVAKNLKTESGLDEEVTTGPMIRERSLNALSLISDAKSKGARLLLGGTEYKP